MNLIRRLHNHEISGGKQSFVYTANLLQALASQPDIVIPVCCFPTINRHLIFASVEDFFRKHDLEIPTSFAKMTLFRIHSNDALFYKTYVLIYGYKNNADNLDFNLYNKIQFAFDMMLQVGRECQ